MSGKPSWKYRKRANCADCWWSWTIRGRIYRSAETILYILLTKPPIFLFYCMNENMKTYREVLRSWNPLEKLLPPTTTVQYKTAFRNTHTYAHAHTQTHIHIYIHIFKNWFMLSVRLSSYGCTREVRRAREKRKGRLTRGDIFQGHVAGKNFTRCSHEGACCGGRFLKVFTRRVLSQGHVVISFSDWFIFRSVAGTCRMNSSVHEATLRLTGV